MSTCFESLMRKYRGSRENKDFVTTHVSMYPYGGIYNIPTDKLESFYTEYNHDIRNKALYGLLEKPKDIGPVLVDVDIAKEGGGNEPLYTEERVLEYVSIFQKNLKKYANIENDEDLICYVLEKKGYYTSENYLSKYKNGFHLHFPKIWMSKNHRISLTESVIADFPVKEFETLDVSASRNNWFLYGSRKSDEQDTYRMSYTISFTGEKLKDFPKKGLAILKLLSIRDNPTGIVYEVNVDKIPIRIPIRKVIKRKTPERKIYDDNEDLNEELIDRCLNVLDSSRADDYVEWIRIGMVLKTIDPENGLERWKRFSEYSAKYDEYKLEKTWDNFYIKNLYTIGTLIYLAKEDDEKFVVYPKKKRYLKKELLQMCKDQKLKGYSTLSVAGLCLMLGLPVQPKNARGGKKENSGRKKVTTVYRGRGKDFVGKTPDKNEITITYLIPRGMKGRPQL